MRILIFVTLVSLMLGCKTKSMPAESNCEVVGTVKDFDGLDGCGLLIELANGDLLNPVKLPKGALLKDNQAIRFTYSVLEDMAGICMREKAMVEISCLEIMSDSKPDTTNCADTTNPFAVDWMDKAIDRHNPNQVIKYKFGGLWGYLYKAIPVSYLYDCKGNLLCQTNGDENDECHVTYLNRFSKGKIIWQGEGVWD